MTCPNCGQEMRAASLAWRHAAPKPLQMICLGCPERWFVWDHAGAMVCVPAEDCERLARRSMPNFLRWLRNIFGGPANPLLPAPP